jgi:hypothetical protein
MQMFENASQRPERRMAGRDNRRRLTNVKHENGDVGRRTVDENRNKKYRSAKDGVYAD